jgi:hypothetical protein
MWVMMWAIMWVTGTMAAMTLTMMPAKGMAGTKAGMGRGVLAEDAAAVAAAAAATTARVVAAYCRGHLLFIVKIFLCGIFMMCGGEWRGHTSTHTCVTLEVCRRTFGWGW